MGQLTQIIYSNFVIVFKYILIWLFLHKYLPIRLGAFIVFVKPIQWYFDFPNKAYLLIYTYASKTFVTTTIYQLPLYK